MSPVSERVPSSMGTPYRGTREWAVWRPFVYGGMPCPPTPAAPDVPQSVAANASSQPAWQAWHGRPDDRCHRLLARRRRSGSDHGFGSPGRAARRRLHGDPDGGRLGPRRRDVHAERNPRGRPHRLPHLQPLPGHAGGGAVPVGDGTRGLRVGSATGMAGERLETREAMGRPRGSRWASMLPRREPGSSAARAPSSRRRAARPGRRKSGAEPRGGVGPEGDGTVSSPGPRRRRRPPRRLRGRVCGDAPRHVWSCGCRRTWHATVDERAQDRPFARPPIRWSHARRDAPRRPASPRRTARDCGTRGWLRRGGRPGLRRALPLSGTSTSASSSAATARSSSTRGRATSRAPRCSTTSATSARTSSCVTSSAPTSTSTTRSATPRSRRRRARPTTSGARP